MNPAGPVGCLNKNCEYAHCWSEFAGSGEEYKKQTDKLWYEYMDERNPDMTPKDFDLYLEIRNATKNGQSYDGPVDRECYKLVGVALSFNPKKTPAPKAGVKAEKPRAVTTTAITTAITTVTVKPAPGQVNYGQLAAKLGGGKAPQKVILVKEKGIADVDSEIEKAKKRLEELEEQRKELIEGEMKQLVSEKGKIEKQERDLAQRKKVLEDQLGKLFA